MAKESLRIQSEPIEKRIEIGGKFRGEGLKKTEIRGAGIRDV
jgi:hypothetical protein